MNQYDETKVIQQKILQGDKKYKDVTLPSRQTSGTTMQKQSYAFLKAQQVYKEVYDVSKVAVLSNN